MDLCGCYDMCSMRFLRQSLVVVFECVDPSMDHALAVDLSKHQLNVCNASVFAEFVDTVQAGVCMLGRVIARGEASSGLQQNFHGIANVINPPHCTKFVLVLHNPAKCRAADSLLLG